MTDQLTSKKVSLLSCQFCGSNRVQVVRSFIDSDSNIVHCPHCDACGPRALSTEPEGTAEARWNASRVTHETPAPSSNEKLEDRFQTWLQICANGKGEFEELRREAFTAGWNAKPPTAHETVTELEALRAENANLRANYMRLMGGAALETLPSPLPAGKPVRTYPDYPVAGIYEAGLGVWNGGTKDEGDI